MKKLIVSQAAAGTPHPPMPIAVSVTTTPGFLIYGLSGPAELQHRLAEPSDLSPNDALIAAVLRALECITEKRANWLIKLHQQAGSLPSPTRKDTAPVRLPVEIRTANPDLIAAGQFLQEESTDIQYQSTRLRIQLQRFAVQWQLLPANAEELRALQRWGSMNCVPGHAGYCDGLTRYEYQAVSNSYEALDLAEGHDKRSDSDLDSADWQHAQDRAGILEQNAL